MRPQQRPVHVLAIDESTGAILKVLSEAGYISALHADLEAAKYRVRSARRGEVWLVPMDESGEAWMEWALQHAPGTHIIALVDHADGESLHRAYELGARYCSSTDPADILRATEFAVDGLDLAGSQTRLRPCTDAQPRESEAPATASSRGA